MKLAKKRGWFVSFVPASFWFDKRTARQISLTGGPLPTDYLCEQGTWPAWTRVFLRGRGPGDERAWERGWITTISEQFFSNREAMSAISVFRVKFNLEFTRQVKEKQWNYVFTLQRARKPLQSQLSRTSELGIKLRFKIAVSFIWTLWCDQSLL